VGRVLITGSFFNVVIGVILYYIAEPLFYILLGILLFAMWKYSHVIVNPAIDD